MLRVMQLKPQDTLLALKHWATSDEAVNLSIRELAASTGISASEASKANQRLIAANLLVKRNQALYVEQGALLEWLSYGVRYAYPALQLGYGRGLATAWNCSLIHSQLLPPTPAMVWQISGGKTEGVLIEPIHPAVPLAATNDALLYQALALVDAIRLAKPREIKIARELLQTLIKGANP